MSSQSLSEFKWIFGLRALALYGIFFSLNDWPYINVMYSCESYLNNCHPDHARSFLSSEGLILGLHIIRLLSYLAIFFQVQVRLSSVIILICSFYFTMQNRLVFSPDIPYMHFLFLTIILAKAGKERFFNDVTWAFSVVIFLSYSFSGFYKLLTPFWVDGSFLSTFVKGNHLAYQWVDNFPFNPVLLTGATYLALYTEALAGLAILNRTIRSLLWFALTGLHLGVLILANIPEVSLGMLTIQIFLLDERTFQIVKSVPKLWGR